MNLADFIETKIEPIMNDRAAFACGFGVPEHRYSESELRDSARQILAEIVIDMRSSYMAGAQSTKQGWQGPQHSPRITGQAQNRADERREKGFTLDEIISEYRALRASIVRRWTDEMASVDRRALDELVSFNEAVDQALTESVRRYSDGLAHARDLFEGVLAHDLRSPLQAMIMSAGYLIQFPELPVSCMKAAVRIQTSGTRMRLLVQHLLDFTRTRLGDTLPVLTRPASMKDICECAIDEMEAFNPDRCIRSTFSGDQGGEWDVERLAQVLPICWAMLSSMAIPTLKSMLTCGPTAIMSPRPCLTVARQYRLTRFSQYLIHCVASYRTPHPAEPGQVWDSAFTSSGRSSSRMAEA